MLQTYKVILALKEISVELEKRARKQKTKPARQFYRENRDMFNEACKKVEKWGVDFKAKEILIKNLYKND